MSEYPDLLGAEQSEAILEMVTSEEMFSLYSDANDQFADAVYKLLKYQRLGGGDPWAAANAWVGYYSSSSKLRWAGLMAATTMAKKSYYLVNQNSDPIPPAQEENIQFIINSYQLSEQEQTGYRDGVYILSVTRRPDESLDEGWLWYVTADCTEERFYGCILAQIIVSANSAGTLSKHLEDSSPEVAWAGIVASV